MAQENKTLRAVFLGPPGAGKGTQVSNINHIVLNVNCSFLNQAPKLVEKCGVCHLATGKKKFFTCNTVC